MATVVFNFRQGQPVVHVQVVVGRGDDFLLVDQEKFTVNSIDMLLPTFLQDLKPSDKDYPFLGPIAGPSNGPNANGNSKQLPRLKGSQGDEFANRVYMINWKGNAGTSGPHFKIFP